MNGLLIAVGDYPEGNATASRLNLISKILAAGGARMTVGLIHATLRTAPADHPGAAGRQGDVEFRFFNGRVTRPAGLAGVALDTWRGMRAAAAHVDERAKARALDFVLLYTPNMLKTRPVIHAARRHGVPMFLEACEIRSQTTGAIGRPRLRTRLANALDRQLEEHAHEFCRGVIPISTGIADYFAARGFAREDIFHLPILVERERYAEPATTSVDGLTPGRFLFNSGSFAEKDGVAFVVRAFERVAGSHPEARLAFSGAVDAPTRERVTGHARSAALAERIVFTGYLSREQLIWCYQNAAALLSCRSDSAYAHLGFPTKLAEYLASGTCVVATDVGDVKRYLEHGKSALIARPEDAQDIAAAFDAALRDPQRARSIGRAGQDVAAAFDYRSYVESLPAFIEQRLDKPS